MSLRRRFFAIVVLSLVALCAAVAAVLEQRAEGSAQREADMFPRVEAVLDRLAARAADVVPAGTPLKDLPTGLLDGLRRATMWVVVPLLDGSAGFCDDQGTLYAIASAGSGPLFRAMPPGPIGPGDLPPGDPRSFADRREDFQARDYHDLQQFDREGIQSACRGGSTGDRWHVRLSAPNYTLLVSLRRIDGLGIGWSAARIPKPPGNRPALLRRPSLVVLAASTLLLVLMTLDALRILRQGGRQLQASLAELGRNLLAEVPRPRAAELAEIADAVTAMARHLATSQDRERVLERELGHEQRLVGLGRVVAGVAHEVRNPLTGLKLKLDTLARRQLDERTARDIATCLQEVERLDRVVRSLLLVARRADLELADCDLSVLVQGRLEACSEDALRRGVALRLDGRDGHARMRANADDFGRLLDNLLRNAIDASPPNSVVVAKIETRPDGVFLSVIDQGAGVPPERVGEVFEPFFTLKPEGTGLGLFLARAIAEAHGGSLRYHRDPNATRFVVSIPSDARATDAASADRR